MNTYGALCRIILCALHFKTFIVLGLQSTAAGALCIFGTSSDEQHHWSHLLFGYSTVGTPYTGLGDILGNKYSGFAPCSTYDFHC